MMSAAQSPRRHMQAKRSAQPYSTATRPELLSFSAPPRVRATTISSPPVSPLALAPSLNGSVASSNNSSSNFSLPTTTRPVANPRLQRGRYVQDSDPIWHFDTAAAESTPAGVHFFINNNNNTNHSPHLWHRQRGMSGGSGTCNGGVGDKSRAATTISTAGPTQAPYYQNRVHHKTSRSQESHHSHRIGTAATHNDGGVLPQHPLHHHHPHQRTLRSGKHGGVGTSSTPSRSPSSISSSSVAANHVAVMVLPSSSSNASFNSSNSFPNAAATATATAGGGEDSSSTSGFSSSNIPSRAKASTVTTVSTTTIGADNFDTLDKLVAVMERGCRVCRLQLMKKWDPTYRWLSFNSHTSQLVLSKCNAQQLQQGAGDSIGGGGGGNATTTTAPPSLTAALPSFLSSALALGAGTSASNNNPPATTGASSSLGAGGSSTNSCATSSAMGKQLAVLDLRLVKETHSLDYKLNTIRISDKWKRDTSISCLDPELILVVHFGSTFVLNNWILLFDSKEACNNWSTGIRLLCDELSCASHHLTVERWLRKQFYSLVNPDTHCITLKQLKPFVQSRLQYKCPTRQLQELTDLSSVGEGMGFEAFVLAHNRLLNFHQLFTTIDFFAAIPTASTGLPICGSGSCSEGGAVDPSSSTSSSGRRVTFPRFFQFLQQQGDALGECREAASTFLRRYLRDVAPTRDVCEPPMSSEEFVDYLFSTENSLFDPVNKGVVQDMTKPLTHYWIASSHNTYLTGDQFKSESSLDAYARALLLGCRCIELDCWDGQRRAGVGGAPDYVEIVIYHGYTMTSKLALRDVLHTIRHYAFVTTDTPLVLSIEDNCSVPAQRQMAAEIKEIFGELLLTAPVNRDEWCLPSPAALRRKIILKHKKLQLENEGTGGGSGATVGGSGSVGSGLCGAQSGSTDDGADGCGDNDILHRDCVKRGVLQLRDPSTEEWHRHVFVLFADRLCYVLRPVDDESSEDDGEGETSTANLPEATAVGGQQLRKNTAGGVDGDVGDTFCLAPGMRDEGIGSEDSAASLSLEVGVRPEEMHITEEWFHGKLGRDAAKARLFEHEDRGNGLFLVRESSTFLGDYTLSFYHSLAVHHCRIRTAMEAGEKRYFFVETQKRDTLYELISYYTRHSLDTPAFRVFLTTPCPQPQPHLDQPWFCASADKRRAEELLDAVREDGAFLVRYSTSDRNVYVLSLRVAHEVWHYRLKRDGRLFVVNQTLFENLNQLVDYYSCGREFVRGITLRFPVNERTVGQYVNIGGGGGGGGIGGGGVGRKLGVVDGDYIDSTPSAMTPAGCYMDLRDLDQEIEVVAIREHNVADNNNAAGEFYPYSQQQQQLCFPAGARLAVLRKEEFSWKGRYEGRVGWFPPECVVEADSIEAANGVNGQGGQPSPASLQYATIELAGTLFERCGASGGGAVASTAATTEREHSFRITCSPGAHWSGQDYIVAAESREEMEQWLEQMHSLARTVNDKLSLLRTKEKQLRIANELSSLVVYCQAVPFNPDFALQDLRTSFYEMCSFSESKHDKLVERGLAQFNSRQLSRVYPQASRLSSSNFNPVPMWNSGCHMVALNYQTGDKAMHLNQGKFAANGRCGYVLKPHYLLDETFHYTGRGGSSASVEEQQHSQWFVRNDASGSASNFPINLSVQVLAGRHLARRDSGKGICSPLVEVEVAGMSADSHVYRTTSRTNNGLNPVWQETFVFNIHFPEVALLRFLVEDGDFIGPKADPFIGQATFPVDCLRNGFRSVPLLNQFNEPLELSALLVRVEIRSLADAPLTNPHLHLQAKRLAPSSSAPASLAQQQQPRVETGSFEQHQHHHPRSLSLLNPSSQPVFTNPQLESNNSSSGGRLSTVVDVGWEGQMPSPGSSLSPNSCCPSSGVSPTTTTSTPTLVAKGGRGGWDKGKMRLKKFSHQDTRSNSLDSTDSSSTTATTQSNTPQKKQSGSTLRRLFGFANSGGGANSSTLHTACNGSSCSNDSQKRRSSHKE